MDQHMRNALDVPLVERQFELYIDTYLKGLNLSQVGWVVWMLNQAYDCGVKDMIAEHDANARGDREHD